MLSEFESSCSVFLASPPPPLVFPLISFKLQSEKWPLPSLPPPPPLRPRATVRRQLRPLVPLPPTGLLPARHRPPRPLMQEQLLPLPHLRLQPPPRPRPPLPRTRRSTSATSSATSPRRSSSRSSRRYVLAQCASVKRERERERERELTRQGGRSEEAIIGERERGVDIFPVVRRFFLSRADSFKRRRQLGTYAVGFPRYGRGALA